MKDEKEKPIVVKPDFWRDPNVGAVGLLVVAVILWVLYKLWER